MTTTVRRRTTAWALVLGAGVVGVVLVVVLASCSSSTSSASHPSPIAPGLATRLADSTPAPATAASAPASTTALPAPRTTHRRAAPPRTASAPAPRTGGGDGGPLSISIPAVGIEAPVVPIGVDAHGSVAIPADVRTVGWYRFSPRLPSRAGSTVLVGHVDSAVQGAGAFFGLHTLTAGATVTVRLPHRTAARYRVVSKEQFPKGNVPLQALFSLSGAPRLTLITCGGSFDETIRSYRDNIVVTAVPR